MHLGGGKVFSGAEGVAAVDLAVNREFAAAMQEIELEELDQFGESRELFGGGATLFEIADETDADGDVVDPATAHVAALELLEPAISDFNLAVAGVAAVSNDKVISQAVGHPHVTAVEPVVDLRVALIHPAVMADDIFPRTELGNAPGNPDHLFDVLKGRGSGSSAGRDFQLLARIDSIARKLIGGTDGGHQS